MLTCYMIEMNTQKRQGELFNSLFGKPISLNKKQSYIDTSDQLKIQMWKMFLIRDDNEKKVIISKN